MTRTESIISWLIGFDESLQKADTDIQSTKVNTYSLVKEPTQTVKSYLSGRKEYTEHYMIQARRNTQYNSDRNNNNAFGELLESWVYEQNASGNFPTIEDAMVKSVTITTPWYVGNVTANDSVYQLTLEIKYEK